MLTVTSGKGGVGKSNVALNLAIALSQAGKSVLLMDVNWGVGNIELLSGLNSQWNLSHVLSGARRLEEVLIPGPEGVTILPGAGSLGETSENADRVAEVLNQITSFQKQFQFAIVDFGTGMHRVLKQFVTTADRVLMVTSAEPPSLAEAYASIKTLSAGEHPKWEILINQAASARQAEGIFQRLHHTTRAFVQTELAWGGWIPQDAHVASAVSVRKPFLVEHPHCPASQAIRQTARGLLAESQKFRETAPHFLDFRSSSKTAIESLAHATIP
jgi:flagellar biosynthesis protein FlhG